MLCTSVNWWPALLLPITIAQETALPGPQCEDFASSYKLSAEQISKADISDIIAKNVEIALNFERSNWATNSVTTDPLYRIPRNWSSDMPAGTLLSVENVTNSSLYTLPPAVSLSRITYQTTTLNDTNIPASAYILWPYLPRTFRNTTGLPVIGWAHGTSGVLPECAPSHIRNLWYQYSGPYIMALQGYVVVAPDYAGLGVGSSRSSNSILSPFSEELPKIIHPYLSSFSHANDLLYSIRAAQSAFPSLSRSFVTIGHSQGGGATWALATLNNSSTPIPGHLGTVAASPSPTGPSYLSVLAAASRSNSSLGPYLAYGIHASFPAVAAPLSAFLTPAAQRRWDLFAAVGGCSSVASALFPSSARTPWLLASTATHPAALSVASSSDYSLRELGAPLLVLQGLADPVVLPEYTQRSVEAACAAAAKKGSSGTAVEYVEFEGVTHTPVMYAGQGVWLEWVAARFEGVEVEAGCRRRKVGGYRGEEGAYVADLIYYLEPAREAYQVA